MKFRLLALSVLIIGVLAGVYDAGEHLNLPGSVKNWVRPFRLGLDLQGGTHLVYRADTASINGDIGEAMAGLRDVIERRVNLFGVSEPIVQTESTAGEQRLIVELAGVFDINQAIQVIGQTPYLEFRELAKGPDGAPLATSSISLNDFIPTALTGQFVSRASLIFDHQK